MDSRTLDVALEKYKNMAKRLVDLTRATPSILRLVESSSDLLKLAELSPNISNISELHSNNTKSYPSATSLEDWLETINAKVTAENHEANMTISLDLGCGATPRNPFGAHELYGVDIIEDLGCNIMRANLAIQPIPFDRDQFDYCTAFDFLEHVPRVLPTADGSGTRFPFVEVMNEIWRILRPGGLFLHQTPAFPCKQAFQDPTHVNLITEDTIPYYFCEPNLYANKIGYGFHGKFECVGQAWLNTAWIVGVLRAVK
jgi:SAM-dependent methyltransferase